MKAPAAEEQDIAGDFPDTVVSLGVVTSWLRLHTRSLVAPRPRTVWPTSFQRRSCDWGGSCGEQLRSREGRYVQS
jgi:hypothetical protein